MAIVRKVYKKKAYKSKSRKGTVSKAVKSYVAHKIKRPEMKQIQLNQVEYAFNTATVAGSILWNELAPLQGTTRETRIGTEIYFQGMHTKCAWNNNGSGPIFVRRLILGYPSGMTTGTGAELYDNGVGGGVQMTTTGTTMALITNKINKAQFKVYYDKTIRLAPSTSTDGNQSKLYNHFQKFGGKRIKFEGPAVSAQGNQDFRIGELYIVAQADNDTVAGMAVELTENLSVYFTDV